MTSEEYSITPEEKEVLLIDGSPFIIEKIVEGFVVENPYDPEIPAKVTLIKLKT